MMRQSIELVRTRLEEIKSDINTNQEAKIMLEKALQETGMNLAMLSAVKTELEALLDQMTSSCQN